MIATLKLSARNLLRHRRRSLLTAFLIALGVAALLLFVAAAGSFKQAMIGEITDSMLGHLQIHKKGYISAVDNLPLNLNLQPKAAEKVEAALKADSRIEAYSLRLKFGAMLSNYTETSNARLNGIDPAAEDATVPGLRKRISEGDSGGALLERGQVLIPTLLAKGMKVKPGDTVVLIATNASGSVNAKSFVVRGILDAITGPGGRDGYIHLDDARELLRMDKPEVMEIAVRLKKFSQLPAVQRDLQSTIGALKNAEGKPVTELHTWSELSPFANIARMIDLMTTFIRVMLVSIVLVSVMNVMLMAVYERIREIGTLAAIGTSPGKILGMFLGEGLLLGFAGAAVGILFSLGTVGVLHAYPVSFAFGREVIVLHPVLALPELAGVLGLAVLVSMVASLQPAWRAAHMDPIAALRHV